MIEEKLNNILHNLFDYGIEIILVLLFSVLLISLLIGLLFLIQFLLRKFNIKNKKIQGWLILLLNLVTFNFLKRISKDEELNKVNMLLYDALDEKLNQKDENYLKTKEKLITDRIQIPDSPLRKEEGEPHV